MGSSSSGTTTTPGVQRHVGWAAITASVRTSGRVIAALIPEAVSPGCGAPMQTLLCDGHQLDYPL
jgi:hypothetical protein